VSIVSRMVGRGRMLYLSGSTPEPAGDVKTQAERVLAHFDELLASAGLDKSKLLTAAVLLSDMGLLPELDAAWRQWVDPQHPPLRICRPAALEQAGSLVQIEVTAAK
jgi:enamine deaminase RidA (YjgF/YER057c/UK114 family)